MRSPLAKPLFCIFVYVLYVAIRRVRQCCVADAVNTHESADTDIVLIPLPPRRCSEKSFKRRESIFPWAYIHFCTTTRYVTLTQMISYSSRLILSFRPSVCSLMPSLVFIAFFYSFTT